MVPKNICAARRFVDLATVGPSPSKEALARSLDEQARSYHDTLLGEPTDSEETPSLENDIIQVGITARFPDFGFYGTVFGSDVPGGAVVGDAIDDILDNTTDLNEALWRFDRFGADDSHWYFRMLFRLHGREHLRGLS